MKKNIEDIKAKKGGLATISRQDIIESPRKKSKDSAPFREVPTEAVASVASNHKSDQRPRLQSTSYTMKKRPPRLRKPLLIAFLIIFIGGGVYFCSTVFQNANIILFQKHQTFTLNSQQFTASQDQNAALPFDIMIVSDTQYQNMTLTQSANVSLKAQGDVMFYNQYSAKPVTVSAHTYVSDTTGKTYLTDKAVTIPGYTTNKTTKAITPGQAAVSITAFLSGDTYNGSPTNFSVNAYKNTSKFSKIYATATTALTGGAQGLIYTLTPEQQGVIDAQAQSSFKDSLMKKVVAQVPDGYLLYDAATQFSYQADDSFSSPTADAQVPISGTVSAVILNKTDLALSLIKSVLPQSTDKEVAEIQLEDMQGLSYSFVPSSQIINKDTQSVSFTLTGTLHADWNPDIAALKINLVGIASAVLPGIFESDPGIANATVKIFPPWQSHLPNDPSKIHIRVE